MTCVFSQTALAVVLSALSVTLLCSRVAVPEAVAQVPQTAPKTKTPTASSGEIVVAMRYLLPEGISHSHLFLYRASDGKLLRQLTRDDRGQDMRPVFSPDGETIVFTREAESNASKQREYWQIRPLGSGLTRLKTAPAWYKPAQSTKSATYTSPYFTNREPENLTSDEGGAGPPTYSALDGSVELMVREVKGDPDSEIDGPGHGKHYVLKNNKTGREIELGKLPGFVGVYDVLRNEPEGLRFLIEGRLRVMFFGLHLDSTAGDTAFALDLSNPRFVRLSPNWAAPFPLPGESAFLTLTEVRYVPITGSKKTANSSYVERWDSNLHKIRFARPNTAARCYGASLYRPGQVPAVITVAAFD